MLTIRNIALDHTGVLLLYPTNNQLTDSHPDQGRDLRSSTRLGSRGWTVGRRHRLVLLLLGNRLRRLLEIRRKAFMVAEHP